MPVKLHRHGFMYADAGGEVVELAYEPLIAAQVEELAAVADLTIEQTKKIINDRGLNPKGKGERLRAVADVSMDKVRKLNQQRRRKLDQDLANAKKNIPDELPVPGGTDPIVRAIRYGEIRQMLLNMPKGLRPAEVQIAAEQNDLEVLLAVQDAPRLMKAAIIDDSTFDKARQRWLELNRAADFQKVKTVTMAISIFTHNSQTAEKIVANAAAVSLRRYVPDVLPELARTA